MNARRLLLVGINLVFVAGLAAALAPDEDFADANPGRRTALATSPAGAVDAMDTRSLQTPASKPLFLRPRSADPVVEDAPAQMPTAPPFRLAGVLWGDGERLAVLQMSDDAGHRRVRLGESVEDWTLSELTPRSATFSAGERSAVLGLSAAPARATSDP